MIGTVLPISLVTIRILSHWKKNWTPGNVFHFIINDKAVKLWNIAVLKGEINYCQVSSRYTPPTKHGILKLMNKKKIRMTEKVAMDLPSKSGSIAITHDGWSSCATESYSTVTAQSITSAWELRSVVLHTHQVQEAHTSEQIADGLKGIFFLKMLIV